MAIRNQRKSTIGVGGGTARPDGHRVATGDESFSGVSRTGAN